MIDGRNYFDQPINNDFKTYENIRKIATGQEDDYKMIATDLSKQQVLDADPRATQLINFTVNVDRAGNTTMFFVIELAKETALDFS